MSTAVPKEHDYIGLSSLEKLCHEDNKNTKTNLKETELRLGLPGSQSPERNSPSLTPLLVNGVSFFGKDISIEGRSNAPLKNLVLGAKRGFSDAIDGNSEKWGFRNDGSEGADLVKKGPLFSPRGDCAKKDVGGVGGQSPKAVQESKNNVSDNSSSTPASKAQVIGWPPIRSFRKNLSSNLSKGNEDSEGKSGYECLYVKVSMDGAPYLRKVDLRTYSNYVELSSSLEKMFRCFTIGQCSSRGLPGRDGLSASHLMDLLRSSEYVLTYEDKDGDWMLVGDVPWEMFTDSCKRLRIMKGSESIGLDPRGTVKCKNDD